jgi:hypothetical protein
MAAAAAEATEAAGRVVETVEVKGVAIEAAGWGQMVVEQAVIWAVGAMGVATVAVVTVAVA